MIRLYIFLTCLTIIYISAIGLDESESCTLFIFTGAGKGIRISESDVRAMGRTAAGVRGIKIKADDEVISLIATDSDEGEILFALTELEDG